MTGGYELPALKWLMRSPGGRPNDLGKRSLFHGTSRGALVNHLLSFINIRHLGSRPFFFGNSPPERIPKTLYHGWATYPPVSLIAGLIKGNHWLLRETNENSWFFSSIIVYFTWFDPLLLRKVRPIAAIWLVSCTLEVSSGDELRSTSGLDGRRQKQLIV